MKFRTAYDAGPLGLGDISCPPEEDRAIQSAAEECDINMIIERANRGIAVPGNNGSPVFGDFVGLPDYQEMLNGVLDAQEAFSSLPARLRARFDNDPAKLLGFVSEPGNREEAMLLGLIERPAPEPPPVAPATTDDPPPA